jgi:hypothetical protein
MGNSSKGSPGGGEVQTAAHDVGAVASCFGAGMSKLQGLASAVKGSNRCSDLQRRPGRRWFGMGRCLTVQQWAWVELGLGDWF